MDYGNGQDATGASPGEPLSASERKYRNLVEATGTGYVILDLEGRVLDANAEYVRLTGRANLQELLGRRVTEWTAAYDLQRNAEEIRKCLERGSVKNLEIDYVDPSGAFVPIEVNATVLDAPTGRQILTLCKDISGRRKLEQSLREMETIFTLLLEHSPVYIFFKDTELRPIYLSRNFEGMLGRPLDQILGKTMDELFPPELAKAMIEDDRRIIQENALVKVDEELGGRYFTTVKFPVLQPGKPPLLAGFTLDITERKQAEKELQESEARFRAIFEQMNLGMVLAGIDGRFIQANPAFQRFLGYTEPELQGMTFREVTHPACLEKDLINIQACLRGELPHYSAEKRYLQKGGQEVWGKVHVKLVRDERGEPRNLIALVEDLSEWKHSEEERRRLEAEIQHAQKLESLGSLAGGVAHDMNNVLQAIQGMASVLKVKFAQDPAIASGLELILNASSRGRDLVRDLTDFARKGLQESQLLDLNELVRTEVGLLQHTTLQRVDLLMELEEPLPRIFGDPSAVSNALMNLCVNALDAMPEKGRLLFRTRRVEGGKVELAVEDSGQGMTPDVLARAAEPFFTTKPVGKGTGLGLSGVYGTMKAHGGTMDLRSEVGQGTKVLLQFPIAEEPLPPPMPVAINAPPPRSEMPMKILLIDDDDLIRDSFPDLMEILGHQVVATAANGSEGLRRIEEGLEVDVVVLDHNMPGLSGIETLTRLQALRPGLPIVFCTGHLDEAVRDQLKGRAKVWILMKPYSIKDVRPLLSQVSLG